jgi:hypothetical protein
VKKAQVVGLVLATALAGSAGCLLGLAPASADVATGVAAEVAVGVAAGPPIAAGRFTAVTVPGGSQVQPQAISDSGVIVGCDEPGRGARQVGFVGKEGKFSTLTDPAAGASGTTCPFSISTAGVIVGYYATSTDHGFVDRNGHFTSINVPGASNAQGEGTFAVDINAAGVIVGRYVTGHDSAEHGFVLRNGKFTTINYPHPARAKDPDTVLTGISDNGTIVGAYYDESGTTISFSYRSGKFTTISVPHERYTEVFCIAARSGLVIGNYRNRQAGDSTGFSERADVYRSIADPAATAGTTADCGNDSGLIVGSYQTKHDVSHGFLFTPAKG